MGIGSTLKTYGTDKDLYFAIGVAIIVIAIAKLVGIL